MADKISDRELAQQYGFAWAVIQGVPEIKALFKKAYGDGKSRWSAEKFKSQFQSSKWYRTHSESYRNARILELSDPKSWAERKASVASKVERVVGAQGIVLPKGITAAGIADALLRSGKADDQAAMLEYLQNIKGVGVDTEAGAGGAAVDALEKLAYDNGYVPSDKNFFRRAATNVAFGTSDITEYENMIRESAAAQYPVWAEQIRSGAATARDLASPYIDAMARTLELAPSDISLQDDQIQKAISAQTDPKTGEPVVQGVWQFTKDLKNDPRWQYTKNAKDAMESTAVGVLKAFGFTS